MRGKWLVVTVLLLGVMLGAVVGLSMAQGMEAEGGAAPQALVGTGFTYQGRLNKGGNPHNGSCDFQFSLHDSVADGSQLGITQTIPTVDVVDGLFTVVLNGGGQFGGSAFNGEARWLAVAVECEEDSDYTVLSPRQALTPAPYALALPGLRTQQNILSPNVFGGWHGNGATVVGVQGATIGGGGQNGWPNQVAASFSTVGGGENNFAEGNHATIGGGAGNYAGGPEAATIAGGEGNVASGNRPVVGGGQGNRAEAEHPTVSGGWDNQATGNWSTVGGGRLNTASERYATISGGVVNTATGVVATVGGGLGNLAAYTATTVSGGEGNTASSDYATVPGGRFAVASHYGEMAYASGDFAVPGDAQTSVYVLRATTTDSDWHELFLDGEGERITVPPERTMFVYAWIVGRSSGGESAGYHFGGVIANVAGSTNWLGAWQLGSAEDDPAWDARIRDYPGEVALSVDGLGNGETIRWVAVVRTVEVAW
jgi:hypothetical protein